MDDFTPVNIDDLMRKVLAILPNATFDEDNDGQIVIYTDCRAAE